MERVFDNVNDAFYHLVTGFDKGRFEDTGKLPEQMTRNGVTRRVPGAATINYLRPRVRVLLNEIRDCNHFFHLFESLWMLAGRNDIAPLTALVKQYAEYSDDGETANGAYGYRWRSSTPRRYEGFGWVGTDQLDLLIDHMSKKTNTRRAVLQMWNVEDDLLKVDTSKDVCCNTEAIFEVVDSKLNMTVINRSNDLVWGMLGANYVHFSFLQEYMSCCLDIPMGTYTQFSTNLHAYLNVDDGETKTMPWKGKEWAVGSEAVCFEEHEFNPGPYLVENKEVFDREVKRFINDPYQDWKEPFLETVAKPMMQAHSHATAKQYELAYEAIERVASPDWAAGAHQWVTKRHLRQKKGKQNA